MSAFLVLLAFSCVSGQTLNTSMGVNPTAINSSLYPDIISSPEIISSHDIISSYVDSGLSAESTLLPTPLPNDGNKTDSELESIFKDFIGDGLCSCDLLVHQCDSLCCCDRDCPPPSQRLFNCSSVSSAHDVCITAGDVVRTALAPCSCPNLSLLCVVSEQDAFMLSYGAAVTVTNVDEFSKFESLYSVPRDTPLRRYQDSSPFTLATSNYLVGDPVVMVVVTLSAASSLTLPSPFNGLQCQDGNPITYFVDAVYKCERRLSQLSSTCSSLSASPFYEGIIILQRPFAISSYVAVKVSSFLCRDDAGSSKSCAIASSDYDNSTSECSNAVWEVSYTIFHNGAGRIDSVSVEITTGNVTEQTQMIQQFSVRYVETNSVTVAIGRRSGNPGYIEGEIILAGSLTGVTIDLNTDSNMWLHIRESARNCDDNRLNRPIRFLWDVQTTCLMSVSAEDLVRNCFDVQQRSFSTLIPDTVLDHVGMFGNSDPLELSQWLEVINETVKAETQPFPSLVLCSNVLTSLDISILYSYTGDVNDPQAALSGVKYTYTSQNIVSDLVRNGKLALQCAVKFINISPRPNQVLQSLKGPVLKLPQDFLYPFFTSSTDLFGSGYTAVNADFGLNRERLVVQASRDTVLLVVRGCPTQEDYRLEEVSVPEVGKEEVLVKVLAAGICAGDSKSFNGAPFYWGKDGGPSYVEPPVIPGHEFVGKVVKLGPGAGKKYGIEVGDHATAETIVPCWNCELCSRGMYHSCPSQQLFGYRRKCQGAMAEYMKYPKGALVHKVPKSIPGWQAAYIEPLANAVHAVERGDIQLSDVVVVSGCGPIGLGMVATAKLKNPYKLIALDLLDWKLEVAIKCGADVVLNASKCDVVKEIKALTEGKGCNIYIEASGNPASVEQGLNLLAWNGKFVQFGVFARETSIDWSKISIREISILGSHLGPYCYPTAISMLEGKKLPPIEQIISHHMKLSEVEKGIGMVTESSESLKIVVIPAL